MVPNRSESEMSVLETKAAIKALGALAQETRLAIFRLLVQKGPEGCSVGEIGQTLGLPNATLSFHLKELSYSGLITSRQEGRFIYYSSDFGAMNGLIDFLTENCCHGEDCGVEGKVCAPARATRPAAKGATAPAAKKTASRRRAA